LEMEQTAAEIRRLKSCINDLLGVLSLPAIWSGHEPSRIAGTLLDVLLGILRLDFVYFRLGGSSGSAPVELVRVAGRRNPAAGPQEVGRALAPLLAEMPVSRLEVPNPLGEGKVRIVSLRLPIQDAVGVVVAASQRADFPTDVEALLLRIAANQAGIGLQEARRVSDQEHTAEEERRAHLWFLESIDSVNRAIQGTNDLEQMMHDVLEAVPLLLSTAFIASSAIALPGLTSKPSPSPALAAACAVGLSNPVLLAAAPAITVMMAVWVAP